MRVGVTHMSEWYGIISLSRHEQVCFMRLYFERYFSFDGISISRNVASLNILCSWRVNLLYYERWTDKRKYFYVTLVFKQEWRKISHGLYPLYCAHIKDLWTRLNLKNAWRILMIALMSYILFRFHCISPTKCE